MKNDRTEDDHRPIAVYIWCPTGPDLSYKSAGVSVILRSEEYSSCTGESGTPECGGEEE